MGKKKARGEYNDFLDGEKLRDNADIRTTLQSSMPPTRDISPPPVRHDRRAGRKTGKGGPKKPPLTHFLCLPLVTDESRPQLQAGLEKLKEELGKGDLVPSTAVRPVGSLHLTLGVMSLDETKLQEAKHYLADLDLHSLLRDISMQILAEKAAEDGTIAENLGPGALPDTDALTINLESLAPMQAPQKTSILYAEPKDASQRLLPFASALRERFTTKGFLLEDSRPLKLHATIINTIYAKSANKRARVKNPLKDGTQHPDAEASAHDNNQDDDAASTAESLDGNAAASHSSSAPHNLAREAGHGPDAKSWLRFDARSLIETYKHFPWADQVRIDKIQICKMGAKKVWSGAKGGEGDAVDERYEVVCAKGIYE
ncbi:uncharacterized protein K460DRAFT_373863 [Cucurbitaria berberidis CBS 394.84]|uniref:A-kinase anchor protein 7-like phosphoesterase domain-containing protein n=1 Tax=Cucurbitaria berberidis CBS 394.84 TaxID=1168544 RepID=A0A9P4LEI9_9PLEO|nr:uncharacterized protein K460DRAFT_373863 [Cucurbitaria berberidis CBS 394.84]KAF1851978.1 hypothetical protein K460DRAFT_373863 [Cucurbitaria berberidis CBS 394.84]